MDRLTSVLIVVVIILIGIVSAAFGYIYLSGSKNPINPINQTSINQSVQNTSNVTHTTVKKTTPTNLISAQRAIDIVQQSSPGSTNIRFSAKLINNNGAPYYLVTVYEDDPTSDVYGQSIGGAKVDAKTGVILDELG